MKNRQQEKTNTKKPEQFQGLNHVSFQRYKEDGKKYRIDIYHDLAIRDFHLRLNKKWINPVNQEFKSIHFTNKGLKVRTFDSKTLIFDFQESKFKPCVDGEEESSKA